MAAITAKHSELEQLSPVGVDIDTVKTQLEEYKVSKEGTGEWRDGMSLTYYMYVHSNRMQAKIITHFNFLMIFWHRSSHATLRYIMNIP